MSNLVHRIRQECLQQLVILDPNQEHYFSQLEYCIFELSGKPRTREELSSYQRIYVHLLFNLKRDVVRLTSTYLPSQLVHVSSSELNEQYGKERQLQREQEEKYKKIMRLEDEDNENKSGAPKSGSVLCRKDKCKSPGVSVMLRQLRSADEPMTQFYLCNKCGETWRVG